MKSVEKILADYDSQFTQFKTFETKIHDADKQLVCTAISTLVVRGAE